jgi:hypothetical protein
MISSFVHIESVRSGNEAVKTKLEWRLRSRCTAEARSYVIPRFGLSLDCGAEGR